jgi:hypothetical protein
MQRQYNLQKPGLGRPILTSETTDTRDHVLFSALRFRARQSPPAGRVLFDVVYKAGTGLRATMCEREADRRHFFRKRKDLLDVSYLS